MTVIKMLLPPVSLLSEENKKKLIEDLNKFNFKSIFNNLFNYTKGFKL